SGGGGDPEPVETAALAAHGLLMGRLEALAAEGDPDASLGADALRRLLEVSEGMAVDLGRLARAAASERDRLWAILEEACGRLRHGTTARELVSELGADHPPIEGLYEEAASLVREVTAFTTAAGIMEDPGGQCRVGPAPPSLRWAMAMMAPNTPFEDPAPAWYWINPPDPSWSAQEREEWMSVFSRTTLPAITIHEVTPGHFAHAQALRGLRSDVRRCLASNAFVEGWAHYVEELLWEEGFRSEDPRFAIGVAVEALVRSTRLQVSIGLHTGEMDVEEAARRFETDALLKGPAARSEAERATFDPTYGRYTWGKLEIMALRDEAQARWGTRYSHRRFNEALLGLGSPPLGLLDHVFGYE
ncbi:MAG: DUF885 family protein, partial [Acidimicrobiales bacterium]